MKRGFVLILGLFLIASISFASAVTDGLCVEAEVSNINPSSIGVDEEFTVGIIIDNCGDQISENVTFEIKDLSPFITVKEPLFLDIGEVGFYNTDRFILYHMKTTPDAIPGKYLIKYELNYGNEEINFRKDGNFSVTVLGDEAELNIASVKTTPKLPKKGDEIELTLRVENPSKGIANSVRVQAEHPFPGPKEAFIGTLDPDEDGPAVFVFVAEKEGEYDVPVRISYEDDFGQHEVTEQVKVTIIKPDTSLGLILGIVIVVLLFAGTIYYFVRKTRREEKVIQQLMANKEGEKDKKAKSKDAKK